MSLETALKTFPDVHPSIVIKTEALRSGVRFSTSAQDEFRHRSDIVFKAYHLFSYDRTGVTTLQDRIPADFFLADGTIVQTRVNESASLVVDQRDGKFWLCDGEDPLGEVTFRKPPDFWNRNLADGTPMGSLVQPINCTLFITINKYCEMWKDNNQCRFCDFSAQTVEQRKRGEEVVVHKDPAKIAQVMEVASQDPRHEHLIISGGTILTSAFGMKELDYYCDRLGHLSPFLLKYAPAHFQVGARTVPEFRRLKAVGVGAVHCNLEVWDKHLWEWMCPGKAKFVGHTAWVRRMERGVDVFGRGNVLCNFVTGIEMAQPYGFKTVPEAIKSTLSGFEDLMRRDVLPRMDMWTVEPNSALAGQEPPPLDYYIEIQKGYMELRYKYAMPLHWGGCRGAGRNDTSFDWEYWQGRKPATVSPIGRTSAHH